MLLLFSKSAVIYWLYDGSSLLFFMEKAFIIATEGITSLRKTLSPNLNKLHIHLTPETVSAWHTSYAGTFLQETEGRIKRKSWTKSLWWCLSPLLFLSKMKNRRRLKFNRWNSDIISKFITLTNHIRVSIMTHDMIKATDLMHHPKYFKGNPSWLLNHSLKKKKIPANYHLQPLNKIFFIFACNLHNMHPITYTDT